MDVIRTLYGRDGIQLAAIIPEGLPRGNSDLRKSGLAPPEAGRAGTARVWAAPHALASAPGVLPGVAHP